MADAHNYAKVDLLHPLTTLHLEHCHTWKDYYPQHCAVLNNRVAVLTEEVGSRDVLHISSIDLHSWTTITLPYQHMSLTTYKSQFVAVGGLDISTSIPTDLVFTSDSGQNWQPSLPKMRTGRYLTTSIGITSPEILVVAWGRGSCGEELLDMELLLEDTWHSVKTESNGHNSGMTSLLHQDEIMFADRNNSSLYCYNIDSLLSSCSTTSEQSSSWRYLEASCGLATFVSYSSRLVEIDGNGSVRGYCNMHKSWIKTTSIVNWMRKSDDDYLSVSYYTLTTILPTGDLIVSCWDGVYRARVSVSAFDPDSKFMSNVLSRLEAVMGIQIVSVLANSYSQLVTRLGVTQEPSFLSLDIGHADMEENNTYKEKILPGNIIAIKLPSPFEDIDPVEIVISQWSEGDGHCPPTWRQLLDVLQDIGLKGLSQQIKAAMTDSSYDVYLQAYHRFISTKDVLEMLFLKFMFLGPPGLGKTTTCRRLRGEIDDLNSVGEADQPQASTGTVESGHDMIVQGLTDTTAVIIGRNWSAVHSLTDEARMLFHDFVGSMLSQTTPVHIPPLLPSTEYVEETMTATVSTASPTSIPRPKRVKRFQSKLITSQSNSGQIVDSFITRSVDNPEITALIKMVSSNPAFWKDAKHLFKAYLRLEDTGGQPELMDMLPALTIGPGLYLLFFSYEFQMDEEYQVFYQRTSGEKSIPLKSVVTLKEMLLCTLSSISCSNAFKNLQQPEKIGDFNMNSIQSSKSVVYLVGTHKDKVSEDYIVEVDRQLQEIIAGTDFYRNGIVQYCSNEKLVISLNNMGGGIEEVYQLRQLLEKAIEKHFKKLKIPASWLLFSLCLRIRGSRIASMETCLELSRALNMTPYETKVALWFLHHHAGVIMYFSNVSDLEDLVIIDVQVVYDSITAVILQAMNFENAGKAKADKFRKTGQFTMEDLISAIDDIPKDLIPPEKLITLLAYLHIIAEIPLDTKILQSVTEESTYIMPCVLEYTTSRELDVFLEEACKSCILLPLSVYFKCGFTPMGLFPAMIACFISNKSFTLMKEGLKKNMVQFLFESKLHVTFISRPKYYKVVVSCQHMSQTSLHLKCAALKSAIETTLQEASSRMNYSSYMDYQFGFECSLHEGEGHLGVVDETESVPENMTCLYNPDKPQLVVLQNRHLIWYGKEYSDCRPLKDSKGGKPFSVFMSVYPDLVLSVKPCVLTVADHCFSRGLISEDVYDQLIKRSDWIDTDKARCLLSNVRTVLSATPQSLEEFVSVLLKIEDCKLIAEKIQQQLRESRE